MRLRRSPSASLLCCVSESEVNCFLDVVDPNFQYFGKIARCLFVLSVPAFLYPSQQIQFFHISNSSFKLKVITPPKTTPGLFKIIRKDESIFAQILHTAFFKNKRC